MTDTVKINRGLKGVYIERSGVSDIDGRAGTLTYRGYAIADLANKASFEEVCYLLIHGELPDVARLAAFDAALKAGRELPGACSTSSGPARRVTRWTCCAPPSRGWRRWNPTVRTPARRASCATASG